MNLDPVFILGPTGSGKSSTAIELAELLIASGQAAEIISADAYQIYRDLPILTAAPSPEELARVPHHMIHELNLEQQHDAAQHARMAAERIGQMQGRGVKAIVTGGSGLYLKFISHGISEAPPSCDKLRAELDTWSQEQLIAEFERVDAEGLAITPRDNRRYLLRNLEIILLSNKPLSHWRQNWNKPAAGLGWSIERPIEELDARIYRRAGEMLAMGLLEEVRALEARTLSATAGKVLGLTLVQDCLNGTINEADMVQRLGLMTRQYAKRQRTWLRREQWVQPIAAEQAAQFIAQQL